MERKCRTLYWKVDPVCPDPVIMSEAGKIIREGGLVAFPTETVYGLGANALDNLAVERIFIAKRRPMDNPLIVHIAVKNAVRDLVSIFPESARILIEKYWPGPLTIVLPKREGIADLVTAGLDSVALRMPDHPVALAFIKASRVPLVAPSANLSGRPSPTTAAHVLDDLEGRIEAVIDAGHASVGVESTVVDFTTSLPVVLRPGGITPEQLEKVLGKVLLSDAIKDEYLWEGNTPRSPGLKYTHCAPMTPVILIEGEPGRVTDKIKEMVRYYQIRGQRPGVLTCTALTTSYGVDEVVFVGDRWELTGIAAQLYNALRRLDEMGLDVILAEGVEPCGLGLAIMDRLRKAAGHCIIKV